MITGMLFITAWLLEKISLIIVFTLASLAIALISFLTERKFLSDHADEENKREKQLSVQQNFSDTLLSRSFFREIKYYGSEWIWILPVLMMVAFIPWGSTLKFFNHNIELQIAKINSGAIYIVGLLSLCIPGMAGRHRAGNYEENISGDIHSSVSFLCFSLSFGLSVISLIMISGTAGLEDIVNFQKDAHWYVAYQPLGFLIFLISSIGLASATFFPFQEKNNRISGLYPDSLWSSSARELIRNHLFIFVLCVITATFYLGGYDIPFLNDITLRDSVGVNKTTLLEEMVFILKILILIFLFIKIRNIIGKSQKNVWMNLGLKILFPLSLANMIITGIIILSK